MTKYIGKIEVTIEGDNIKEAEDQIAQITEEIINNHDNVYRSRYEIPEKVKMTKNHECKMRREGIPLTPNECSALLNFIDLVDHVHGMIEPEIIIKLELLAGRYLIVENAVK